MLAELVRERRAVEVRVARERRWIAAQDAGLYRDALGVVPPSGLPEAFLADVPEALRALAARHARSSGPFTTGELAGRYGVDVAAVLRELEAAGALVRGELRPLSHPLARAGERVWVGAGAIGRRSGRVALYFRDDAAAIGPPAAAAKLDAPIEREHELIRERLRGSPCFFGDLVAELEVETVALQ